MKDFARVGRRLRRYRILAFFLFAIAGIIAACGTVAALDRGSPVSWRNDAATNQMAMVMLLPGDPEYEQILRARWSEFMFTALWAGGFGIFGYLAFAASSKPPTKELLLLAQARQGILTLPEVSTALDIDPYLAAYALRRLQKLNIAIPCWQEIRKNLWEFPDYMPAEIMEPIEMARSRVNPPAAETMLNSKVDALDDRAVARAASAAQAAMAAAS
jgi:hypothetical protein